MATGRGEPRERGCQKGFVQVYQVLFSTQHHGMLEISMQTPHGGWDVMVEGHPTHLQWGQ